MADMAAARPVGEARLASGAIGLAGQLFQSITHMAPAAGVIFSAGFMATRGGGSLALAWGIATVACALTAICLADVVRKVRSAGGYFVIHSVALGHFVGFSTSWLWFLFEPLVPAALSMFFGLDCARAVVAMASAAKKKIQWARSMKSILACPFPPLAS